VLLLSAIPFYGIFPRFLSTDTIYGDLSMSGAHPVTVTGRMTVRITVIAVKATMRHCVTRCAVTQCVVSLCH